MPMQRVMPAMQAMPKKRGMLKKPATPKGQGRRSWQARPQSSNSSPM
jgi:hypothetical protein